MIVSALLLPALLAAAAPDAGGASAPPASNATVAITLTVGRSGGPPGTGDKVFKLLAREGSKTSMLMGWRTPLPTRSSEDKGGEPSATSFIYQNIGVSADLETQSLGGGRYVVSGSVEISGVRDGTGTVEGGKPPRIGTFQQALQVVVSQGKTLRVAEVPDPEEGTLHLDIRVDRLE